jgi:hypothetical protein
MDSKRIEGIVLEILQEQFPNDVKKHKIYLSANRLNFSCPYCGDSKDSHKKRGNLYLDTLSFKCYNGGCSIFKDGVSLLKDFGKINSINANERNEISQKIRDNKEKRITRYGNFDVFEVLGGDYSSVLVPRDYLKSKLYLKEVKGTSMEAYLIERNQIPDSKFLWDQKGLRLFVLNLTNDGMIVGLQTRNMRSNYNGGSKYLTYKLSGIWGKLLYETNEEFLEKCQEIDPISSIFGIAKVNLGGTLTVFEGPMDSFLYPNSLATCSVENKVPFEIDGLRFWDDWDDAGRAKSTERLMHGEMVFNWGKFLMDHQLKYNQKWDLNELVNYLRSNGKKIKRFENYFTTDKLDIRWLIGG